MVQPTLQLSGHIPALDGIRGCAILLVTAYRFNLGPECEELPGKLLFGVLRYGELGVDLFFVLSGFLITGILFDAKQQAGYFRNFYARRALRIFPLYYGFLLVTLFALPAILGRSWNLFPEAREHQSWLWLYGANFLMGARNDWCLGSFTHFWSLSIEEQFYLAWPLVIFICSRRQAMFVTVLIIAASIIGRAAWLRAGEGEIAAETYTFLRLDALGLGGFLALAARGEGGLKPLVRWAGVAAGVCAAAMIAVALLHDRQWFGLTWAVVAGFFGAVLILAVSSRSSTCWGKLWRWPVLRFFGKYSYAMYVFQLPLIIMLEPVITAQGACSWCNSVFLGRLAYIAIMTLVTTVCAVLSWHLFEKHFMAMKRHFS